MNAFQVSIAAESLAASLFAQAGFNVSVQYGANQPNYDLIIERSGVTKLVSVKGSSDGGWTLGAKEKKGRTYHEATEAWQKKHSKNLIYCFVQYYNIEMFSMPNVYIATVEEVARHLKALRGGLGNTVILESYEYAKGAAKGIKDAIPPNWRISMDRINELVES